MQIAEEHYEQSLEEYCEENGLTPAGEQAPAPAFANEEEWLASLPPEVAAEIRQQLDGIEEDYKNALRRLFEQSITPLVNRLNDKDTQQKAAPDDVILEDDGVDLTDADVMEALSTRTPEMQALLMAQQRE